MHRNKLSNKATLNAAWLNNFRDKLEEDNLGNNSVKKLADEFNDQQTPSFIYIKEMRTSEEGYFHWQQK